MFALHPWVSDPTVTAPSTLPAVAQNATEPRSARLCTRRARFGRFGVGGFAHAIRELYLTESEKNASSAVTRFRRSDFIAATSASSIGLGFGGSSAGSIGIATSERLSPRWYEHSSVTSREPPGGRSLNPYHRAASAPSVL